MRLIDEFNAATESLDRILKKIGKAASADKVRLKAYVKSMQPYTEVFHLNPSLVPRPQ